MGRRGLSLRPGPGWIDVGDCRPAVTTNGIPMNVAALTSDPAFAHRRTRAVVTVRGADGQRVAPGTRVQIAQERHTFAFGNIGFDFLDPADSVDHEHLARQWFDLFNTVTLPFYWANFEPVQGQPDTARLHRAARWFAERGADVKGHPLVWHTLAPRWLLDLAQEEVEPTVTARIRRELADFAGLVHTWDAINEAVIMPVFAKEENAITRLCQRLGRVETVRLAVETAREADPGVTLVLNDFNMSPSYEQLVAECLDAGIRIDALGLQSHMHQGYWGQAKTLDVLERFSRFGLPLHFTETTLVSGELMPPEIVDLNDHQVSSWPSTAEGEERQATEIVEFYSTLVSHRAVQAITYWGLTDDGAWLGAPAGLVRRDGTLKPAYEALHGLIKGSWWLAPTTVTADESGQVVIDAFAGTYRVTTDAGAASVELAAGPTTVEAALASVAPGSDGVSRAGSPLAP